MVNKLKIVTKPSAKPKPAKPKPAKRRGCAAVREIKITDPKHVFFENILEPVYSNGYRLKLTEDLLKGKITKQLALCTNRTLKGDCVKGAIRYKEEEAVLGLLKCNQCGIKSGDAYGPTKLCVTVLHFDVDGLTEEHEKYAGAASRKIGVTRKEISEGVAQMLCKFCHATKPNY